MTALSSRELLKAIATRLKPLLREIVFVGGCATELLITDPGAPPVRVTDDVDVIVEIASRAEYERFSKRLRKMGFSEDSSEDAPICRWRVGGMKLDVMPTDSKILGFSNRWYKPAIAHARSIMFEGLELRVVTTPYFLATKIDAFKGRGREDFQASKDLEDIITVIDGRPTVLEEVRESDDDVRTAIAREVGTLLANREFLDALPGHVLPDPMSQARIPRILEALRSLHEPNGKQRTPTRRKRNARPKPSSR